jgi:hypothetical protein
MRDVRFPDEINDAAALSAAETVINLFLGAHGNEGVFSL